MSLRAKRGLAWLATFVAPLALAGIALALVSANFDLSWHLLSGGGRSRSSANCLGVSYSNGGDHD